MTPETGGWEALLKRATVMIARSGGEGDVLGTGFFVAPGLVVTCAHVVAERGAPPSGAVAAGIVALDRDLTLLADPSECFRDPATGLDLALLRVREGIELAEVVPVPLTEARLVGDELWTYGHPAGVFRAGQSATFVYQGDSRRTIREAVPLPRVHGVSVGGGFSGSPVVNLRTGAVCGMLSTSHQGSGSAHLVPAGEIITRFPEVAAFQAGHERHSQWLPELTDSQLAEGRWRHPGRRLRSYLNAAVRAAEQHPYPGALPGSAALPPLSAVYVRQDAKVGMGGTQDAEVGMGGTQDAQVGMGGTLEAERLPAATVLTKPATLLVGEAGAGKSAFLRAAVSDLARPWLRDGPGGAAAGRGGEVSADLVPVRVLAADLRGESPLARELAAAVRADLSPHGIVTDWEETLFDRPPLPGARWLVLVDALDEIVVPERRRGVLERLAVLQREAADVYRFVVTTRPLPASEPAPGSFDRYTLLPFEPTQLRALAEGWFTALGLSAPEAAAKDFLGKLNRREPAPSVRTPLMATLLCQLYAADSGTPLPEGDFRAYEAFVTLLWQRQYPQQRDTSGGVMEQVRTMAGPYGPRLMNAAGELPARLFDLLPRLAFETLEGGSRPAVDLVMEWTADLRPDAPLAEVWRSLVAEGLRRTGLLTERAGELVFLHQTFAEFLAARHVSADERLRAAAVRRTLGGLRMRVPDHADPYTRFLIHALRESAGVRRKLRRVAASRRFRQGIPVVGSIVALARSVPLTPDVVDTAAGTLRYLASSRRIPGEDRWRAARSLVELDRAEGITLMAAVARDLRVDHYYRVSAIKKLGLLEDPRVPDTLAALASDAGQSLSIRSYAAKELLFHDDPRGTETLVELAATTALRQDAIYYADWIAPYHPERGAALLEALAKAASLPLEDRLKALELLQYHRGPRVADLLAELADSD